MPNRRRLENRRLCETFKMRFGKIAKAFHITVGYFDKQGKEPGEVFIVGSKSGEEFEAICRDSAILLSFALQYGAPLDAISQALTRNGDESPSTVVGAVTDMMIRRMKDDSAQSAAADGGTGSDAAAD